MGAWDYVSTLSLDTTSYDEQLNKAVSSTKNFKEETQKVDDELKKLKRDGGAIQKTFQDFAEKINLSKESTLKYGKALDVLAPILTGIGVGVATVATSMEAYKKIMDSTGVGSDKLKGQLSALDASLDFLMESFYNADFSNFLTKLSKVRGATEAIERAMLRLGRTTLVYEGELDRINVKKEKLQGIIDDETRSKEERLAAAQELAKLSAQRTAILTDLQNETNNVVRGIAGRELRKAGADNYQGQMDYFLSRFDEILKNPNQFEKYRSDLFVANTGIDEVLSQAVKNISNEDYEKYINYSNRLYQLQEMAQREANDEMRTIQQLEKDLIKSVEDNSTKQTNNTNNLVSKLRVLYPEQKSPSGLKIDDNRIEQIVSSLNSEQYRIINNALNNFNTAVLELDNKLRNSDISNSVYNKEMTNLVNKTIGILSQQDDRFSYGYLDVVDWIQQSSKGFSKEDIKNEHDLMVQKLNRIDYIYSLGIDDPSKSGYIDTATLEKSIEVGLELAGKAISEMLINPGDGKLYTQNNKTQFNWGTFGFDKDGIAKQKRYLLDVLAEAQMSFDKMYNEAENAGKQLDDNTILTYATNIKQLTEAVNLLSDAELEQAIVEERLRKQKQKPIFDLGLTEEQLQNADYAIQAVNSLSQAMTQLGEDSSSMQTFSRMLAIGALITGFIVQLQKCTTVWEYIAAAASGMGTLVGVISQIPSFSQGGIFEGNTSMGDYNIARVNSGEMILNTTQQGRLFKMLNSGNPDNPNNKPQNVEFELRGDRLIGVIRNYEKIHKR